MFKKGTKLVDEKGVVRYEKLDDDNFGWWLSHTSTFSTRHEREVVVTKFNSKTKKEETTKEIEVYYENHPESEKPLYKKNDDGTDSTTLNRFGFRWTDEQILNYYTYYKIVQP